MKKHTWIMPLNHSIVGTLMLILMHKWIWELLVGSQLAIYENPHILKTISITSFIIASTYSFTVTLFIAILSTTKFCCWFGSLELLHLLHILRTSYLASSNTRIGHCVCVKLTEKDHNSCPMQFKGEKRC